MRTLQRGGHSSGAAVTSCLMRPTRAAMQRHIRNVAIPAPPLFGFAPGGACHAAAVAGRAVRSYRTFSPLPDTGFPDPAVQSLWRYPWGHPRRTLSGTVSPWSPDFPLALRPAAARPTGECTHKALAKKGEAAMHDNALTLRHQTLGFGAITQRRPANPP